MNRSNRIHLHSKRTVCCLILATLLLLQTLAACTSPGGMAGDGTADSSQDALMTLPPETSADEIPQPPLMDLLDGVDYDALVITSYYAAGNVAGQALVAASYVEIYNTSDTPIPLAGTALYVSNRGEAFEEYRFSEGMSVPAHGYFLVRGQDANGSHADALTLEHSDARFATMSPHPKETRIAIAAAGKTLRTDLPMAELEGLFAYVTTHSRDAADTLHYMGSASVGKVIRKKAATEKTDYRSINLKKSSYTVLSQIRPHTTEGDVNTRVNTLIDEVVFSHPGGVYAEGFDLTMTAPEGYTIYFTVNDSDPRAITPTRYTTPLHLQDTTDMAWGKLTAKSALYMGKIYDPLTASFPGAAVIKAYAVRESDGARTPLTTQTYFIGELYKTWGVDIVSVSVNSDDFIGKNGIYNTLRTDADGGHAHIPAYVEFISPEGEVVHMGWSEIAMNGRGSLGMTQKSFRILFKSNVMDTEEAGENLNTLNYDLFKEYASVTPDGERVTWYRHVLLRNGGGDMSGSTISRSHIGDAYIQRLDRFLVPDIMAYAPVMTFVNGEFWGTFNARDRMDPKYFEGKYGIAEEDFALLECPYPLTFGWNVDYTTANGDPQEAVYFMELVNFCLQNDMSLPDHYAYIEERIDIDGLIDQYCAQIYLNCSDWPSNNIKVWRNTNPAHPSMDTKWHFTIVDTDHGVGLNSSIHTNLWGVINDGPVLSRIVNHLLQNPDFRHRFLMRYVWCIEVYFTPERMVAELDTLVDTIRPVMQYQLDRFRCLDGTRTDWDIWYSYIETIRDYAHKRPSVAKEQFIAWASITERYYQGLLSDAVAEWGRDVGRPTSETE